MNKNEKISLKLKELWQNPDWKKKMIELRKGKIPWNKGLKTGLVPKSAFKRGCKQSPESIEKRCLSRFGYKHSEETKKRIGLANLGKKALSGNRHYKWQGGYSKSQHKGIEYDAWRMSVYKRDSFICKINNEDCEGKIEAHHILGFTKFPELRYEINNGITLCRKHHPRKMVEEARLAPVFQDIISAIAN